MVPATPQVDKLEVDHPDPRHLDMAEHLAEFSEHPLSLHGRVARPSRLVRYGPGKLNRGKGLTLSGKPGKLAGGADVNR
jgi:hypothetical protein